MSDEDRLANGESRKQDADEEQPTSGNILRIADELVRQIDRTKKLVLAMIVAVIIAVPVSWHLSPLLSGTPYNFQIAGYVTIIIALIFIGIGARQWLLFSKWTRKYKAYKELQEKVDRKLDFESNSEDQNQK